MAGDPRGSSYWLGGLPVAGICSQHVGRQGYWLRGLPTAVLVPPLTFEADGSATVAVAGCPGWEAGGSGTADFIGSPGWHADGSATAEFNASPAWQADGSGTAEFRGSPGWEAEGAATAAFTGSPDWEAAGSGTAAWRGYPWAGAGAVGQAYWLRGLPVDGIGAQDTGRQQYWVHALPVAALVGSLQVFGWLSKGEGEVEWRLALAFAWICDGSGSIALWGFLNPPGWYSSGEGAVDFGVPLAVGNLPGWACGGSATVLWIPQVDARPEVCLVGDETLELEKNYVY